MEWEGAAQQPACLSSGKCEASKFAEVQVGRSPKYETRRYRTKQQAPAAATRTQPASKGAWIKDLGPWPLKGIGYQQVA